MKKENGWYIDEQNNKWNCLLHTEEEAKAKSASLNNCSDCSDCSRCSDCSDCSRCSDCYNCSDCSNCSDFKENPEHIVSGKIGSRNGQTTIYYLTNVPTQVICGCFRGTIQEFENVVEKTHGNTVYGEQYRIFIKKVKQYWGI